MNLSQQLKILADKVVYAELTLSEYYNIGCIKVRVSDHMSNDMDCDLAIFGSKDAAGKRYVYAVIPMVGTFKEVQWFTNASSVIDFIIKFESIARLLIKSPTRNTNQKERAEFNAMNKAKEEEAEKKIELEPDKHNVTVCKNQMNFDAWKSKLGTLYTERKGALSSLLNEIYHFSGDNETMQRILSIVNPIPHAQKKLCLEAMLNTILKTINQQ